ncbi:MAG: hypothetical protein WAS07_00600, partial [Micropruina sp.]
SYSQSSHKQKFVLNALTLSTLLSSQVSGAHLAPALHHRLGQLAKHYLGSSPASNRGFSHFRLTNAKDLGRVLV